MEVSGQLHALTLAALPPVKDPLPSWYPLDGLNGSQRWVGHRKRKIFWAWLGFILLCLAWRGVVWCGFAFELASTLLGKVRLGLVWLALT
jgi:hypothetical protein